MKAPIHLVTLAALLLMGGTSAFLHQVRTHQRLGPPGVKLAGVPGVSEEGRPVSTNSVYLPPELLGATASNLPVSKMELYWLPPDTTYGRSIYQWPDKPAVQVSVVLMGSDRTSIHKPDLCLSAQGWDHRSSDTEVIYIPMSRPVAYDLPVMKITTTRNVRIDQGGGVLRGVFLYWFVTDHKISAWHSERMKSQTLHLLRTGELERWAYISAFAYCLPGQENATLEWMKRVIQEAAPQFQRPPADATEAPRRLTMSRPPSAAELHSAVPPIFNRQGWDWRAASKSEGACVLVGLQFEKLRHSRLQICDTSRSGRPAGRSMGTMDEPSAGRALILNPTPGLDVRGQTLKN